MEPHLVAPRARVGVRRRHLDPRHPMGRGPHRRELHPMGHPRRVLPGRRSEGGIERDRVAGPVRQRQRGQVERRRPDEDQCVGRGHGVRVGHPHLDRVRPRLEVHLLVRGIRVRISERQLVRVQKRHGRARRCARLHRHPRGRRPERGAVLPVPRTEERRQVHGSVGTGHREHPEPQNVADLERQALLSGVKATRGAAPAGHLHPDVQLRAHRRRRRERRRRRIRARQRQRRRDERHARGVRLHPFPGDVALPRPLEQALPRIERHRGARQDVARRRRRQERLEGRGAGVAGKTQRLQCRQPFEDAVRQRREPVVPQVQRYQPRLAVEQPRRQRRQRIAGEVDLRERGEPGKGVPRQQGQPVGPELELRQPGEPGEEPRRQALQRIALKIEHGQPGQPGEVPGRQPGDALVGEVERAHPGELRRRDLRAPRHPGRRRPVIDRAVGRAQRCQEAGAHRPGALAQVRRRAQHLHRVGLVRCAARRRQRQRRRRPGFTERRLVARRAGIGIGRAHRGQSPCGARRPHRHPRRRMRRRRPVTQDVRRKGRRQRQRPSFRIRYRQRFELRRQAPGQAQRVVGPVRPVRRRHRDPHAVLARGEVDLVARRVRIRVRQRRARAVLDHNRRARLPRRVVHRHPRDGVVRCAPVARHIGGERRRQRYQRRRRAMTHRKPRQHGVPHRRRRRHRHRHRIAGPVMHRRLRRAARAPAGHREPKIHVARRRRSEGRRRRVRPRERHPGRAQGHAVRIRLLPAPL